MNTRRSLLSLAAVLGLVAATGGLTGCSVAPKSEGAKVSLHESARAALARMQADDPGLNAFVSNAYGYAIYPGIGKGGFIVGGAYGRGEVYQQGEFIGYSDITKLQIGAIAGGQSMDELVVFQTPKALEDLKFGKLKFAADASAVAVKQGAAASANYRNGVAVFARPEGGLMVEAAVGGQEFGFEPSNRDVKPPTSELRPPATQPGA